MDNKEPSFFISPRLIILFVLVLIGFFIWASFNGTSNTTGYNLMKFEQEIKEGNFKSVDVYPSANSNAGKVYVDGKKGTSVSFYVSDITKVEEIVKSVDSYEGDYSVHKPESGISSNVIIIGIIGVVAVVVFMFFVFIGSQARNIQGTDNRMANFGKSRARKIAPDDPAARKFDDVAGMKEEKEEMQEFVDFLKAPEDYTKVGARIPKGVILVGSPGTGKTLLAKAIAGEAGVPFFSLSGSDFVEMFVGVGASRVRDLFEQAKANSPCIIFIDEIDAVARKRGSGMGGGHDEREQTLNQLLVEMDGFGVNEGIIVMAATNRIDILDPAILRPGRFDRHITVSMPDVAGREEILKVHAFNKPIADDVDFRAIARITAGFSGADLENLMNESAIRCAKDKRQYITDEDIRTSFIKIGIGAERKSRKVTEHDRKITAYHEAGHAILFHVLPDVGPVHTISIIPTGTGAAGYTMPINEKDNIFRTRGEMIQDIKVSLGGRIAESLIFDDVTTGASQDIKQATSIARDMVTKFGFSDSVGMINYANEDEMFIGRDMMHAAKAYSEKTASIIDCEVKKIIDSCYEDAKMILMDNINVLHKSAEMLLEKERITREEFEMLFEA